MRRFAGMGGGMGLVAKAVWFVESRFADELSLEDIAAARAVSRFHLSRAFVDRWLPEARLSLENARDFERYAADFNSATGEGGVEIWIPVRSDG